MLNAVAGVGGLFAVTVRDELLIQTPFTVCQRNVFGPRPRPVTAVLYEFALPIEAGLERTAQVPGLEVGEIAESIVEPVVIQTVWFGPALAIGGIASTWIDIVLELPLTQALLIDHRRTFSPTPRPVTILLGVVGATIVPVPTSIDQDATPPVGVSAARVVLLELTQSVWLTPALAVLGVPVMAIITVAVLGAQTPLLLMDHCKMFAPGFNVTWVVANDGVPMVPLPCANDHTPVFV